MAVKYYRPNRNRRTTLVPTKRFFIIIGAIAAAVVAIILIVTLCAPQEPSFEDDQLTAEEERDPATVVQEESNLTVSEEETTQNVFEDEPKEEETTLPEVSNTPDDPNSVSDPPKEDASNDPITPEESNAGTSDPGKYTQLGIESEGDNVKKLQEKLIELGYLDSKATGYYGTDTYDAVKEFQEKNSLDVDGIAGAKTQEVLFSGNAVKN